MLFPPYAGALHQPPSGVKAAHVLELALADFVVIARSVEAVAVVGLDADVRQLPRTIFAKEEQVADPTVRQADAPAVVDLVGPPAQRDADIVEGALGKAVAVHLRLVARQRGAGHIGHAQVLPTTLNYVGSGRHYPPLRKQSCCQQSYYVDAAPLANDRNHFQPPSTSVACSKPSMLQGAANRPMFTSAARGGSQDISEAETRDCEPAWLTTPGMCMVKTPPPEAGPTTIFYSPQRGAG